MKKQPDQNAQEALNDLKMEIANELNVKLSDVGKIGGTMTKRLVEMGQKQIIKNKNL